MDIQRKSHMWTTCGKTERTRRHLSPTTVFGAGSFFTFPTFPETGTAEDSRNFRNEPGGGGGVETGWDIKVSVVEWCYQRTLFLGLQEERNGEQDMQTWTVLCWSQQKYSSSDCFSRLFGSFIILVMTCCNFTRLQRAASCLHSAHWTHNVPDVYVREKIVSHFCKSTYLNTFFFFFFALWIFISSIMASMNRRNDCFGLCQSAFT